MIKRVLLATDLGITMPHLFEHAANLSNQYGAELVVLHSIEPPGAASQAMLKAHLSIEASQFLTEQGIEAFIQQVRVEIIDHLTDEFMAGESGLAAIGSVVVRMGKPADVILQVAEEIEAGLIVMGSRSHQGDVIDEMGTVTRKVLRSTKVPVYVVPVFQAVWQQDSRQQLRLI